MNDDIIQWIRSGITSMAQTLEGFRIHFRYRCGDVVLYGPTRTPVTILWQCSQTRVLLTALVTYMVEDAEGKTFWVKEADLREGEGEASRRRRSSAGPC